MGKDAKNGHLFLYAFADLVAFNLSILTAFLLRLGTSSWSFNFATYLDLLPFMLAIPVLAFALSRVYSVKWRSAPIEDYVVLFKPIAISWVSIMVVAYIYREGTTGRLPSSVMLMAFPLAAAYIFGWRLILRKALWESRLAKDKLALLAVGFDARSYKVLQAILADRYDLIGVLTDGPADMDGWLPERCLGRIRDIAEVLSEYDVDEVVVNGGEMHNGNASAILNACQRKGISIRVTPTMLSMLTSRAHVEMVGFVPTVVYRQPHVEGWAALGKRAIDTAASIFLLAALSPVLAFCAAWITMDSRGGFLFRQQRVGRGGKLFTVYKFRTMYAGGESHAPLTRRDDPRITRAGSFLRKWSLDELPQLVNVLFGDMSLVGPRAVVPYVADQFDEFERLTLNVLPGITGLAQVNGRDELAFKDKSLLNLYYITNYSLLLDLEIMARTLAVVAHREGTNGTRVEPHPAPKLTRPKAAPQPVEAGHAS